MLGINFKHILFLIMVSLFLAYLLNKRNHARRKLLSDFYQSFSSSFIDLFIIFLPFMFLDFILTFWFWQVAYSESATNPQMAMILIMPLAYLAGQYHVFHSLKNRKPGLKNRLSNIKGSFIKASPFYLRYLCLILVPLFLLFSVFFGLNASITASQVISSNDTALVIPKTIAVLSAFGIFSLLSLFYFGKYALTPTISIAKQLNINSSFKLVNKSLNFKLIRIIIIDFIFLVFLPLLILFILPLFLAHLMPSSTYFFVLSLIWKSLVSVIYFAWLICWQAVLAKKYILKSNE